MADEERPPAFDLPLRAIDRDGVEYQVRALAESESSGGWLGRLEFSAVDRLRVRTASETTQSTPEAVGAWATGLGPLYLQGALERAKLRAGWKPPGEVVSIRAGVLVAGQAGASYLAEIRARWDSFGTWLAWIEFRNPEGALALRTSSETSQPDLAAVVYWADGLSPLYFAGALVRAAPP
jgi:hypothetical protein